MKDIVKHGVTLAWFTGVLAVMFMIAFSYLKSTVANTKAEIMQTVSGATDAVTAPIRSLATGVAELPSNVSKGLTRFENEVVGRDNAQAALHAIEGTQSAIEDGAEFLYDRLEVEEFFGFFNPANW